MLDSGSEKMKSQIKIRKRMDLIESYMLRGVTNQIQIATAVGTTQRTVSDDMKRIFNRWREEDKIKHRQKKQRRIRQLELSAREAFNAWERSKQNTERITTVYSPRKCPECGGTGFRPESDEWCENCKGEGTVLAENVTRTIQGQAGDSSLLGRFNECVREMSRLEGHYPGLYGQDGKGGDMHVHEHKHLNVDLRGVPGDAILDAMRAIAKLKGFGSERKVIDVQVGDDDPGEAREE